MLGLDHGLPTLLALIADMSACTSGDKHICVEPRATFFLMYVKVWHKRRRPVVEANFDDALRMTLVLQRGVEPPKQAKP